MSAATRPFWTGVTVGCVLLVVALAGGGCRAKPPTTGTITAIEPGLRACHDEQTEYGPRPAVAISYRPIGVDSDGRPWATSFVCVTQDVAMKYEVGDTYP